MTDKYDLSGIDSLPAAPAAPASAKYDLGAIDAIPEATGFDKSAALFTAAFGNPSEEAQKRRLSSDITRIVGAYEPVLDVKEGMRRHQQLEADHATRASPRTSAFLSVPENAAVAIQDAKTMAQIEAIIGGDPARALEITAKRLAMAPANLGAWGFDVAAVVPDIAGEGLAAVGLPNEYNVFRDMASGSRRHATAARAAVDYLTPEARNMVERAAASAGTSAGTSLQLLPLAMSGAGAPMALAFGLGTFGESYTKAREQGRNPIQALQYAIPQGAYEALFEMAPAAFLADALKTAPGLKQFVAGLAAREVPTEMATTVAQNLNDWVTFNPNKSVADFIAEQPEALAETIIATVMGAGVQAGIIHGAQRTTGQFQQMQGEAQRTKQLQETLTGLMDQAKNVKSDPVTFQNFMAGVTDNATVFINADALQDTLAQNKMDVSVLPSLAEQLAQPSVTGDVEVPIGELMTAFAGTPAQEQVVQHARVRQDDLSAAEQARFGDMGAFFKKQGEAVMEKQKANESFVSERQEIEADIVKQLGAASPFQEREHRYYAQMMGAFYSTAADLMGTTPKQIQARWAPNILGATDTAQPGTLPQGFDHGEPMVNIGLDIGDVQNALSEQDAIAMLQSFGVTVTKSKVQNLTHDWGKENTLVAHLDRALTPDEMTQLMAATQQEAIPQYAGGVGTLYHATPEAAEKWGPFNPEYFRDLEGVSLLDSQKELAQSQSTRRPTTKRAAEDHLGDSVPGQDTGVEPGAGERAAAGTAGANLARKLTDHEDAVAEYNALNNTELGLTTEGGRVLNTDLARELSPEYRAKRSISQAVHEPASAFIKKLYAEKLAAPTPEGLQPIVVFTAGGTGAGKSSGLKHLGALGDVAEIIYDTNMNTLASATKKIEQALAAGRSVTINYTYRDPVEALTGGALPRAMRMGRTVPLAEHVKTHVGSREVIAQLEEKYQGDDRITFVHVDNSNGRGKAKVAPLAEIPEVVYDSLQEKLNEALDKEHQAGRISDEVRRAFRESATAVRPDDGAGDRGQSQPRGAGGDLAQLNRNVGAVAGPVVGIHFSKAERPALASSAWGTGMRGAEGDYVRTSADKRLRHRITFYVNTGSGIKPESDVGTHAHAAVLRNLYDVDADALKIWKNNQDERARESAVLDAGFDGYLSRNFGSQGAVVMLGERSQSVEYLGNYAGSAWTLPKDLKDKAVAAAQAVHKDMAGGTSREDLHASGKVVQVNSLQDLDSTYPEAQAAALGELLKAFGQPHDAKAVAGFLKGRTGSEALQAVLAEQSAQKAVAARAEVVPSAEIPKMKQAAMAIMQNRALPNGRQSVASWKRDLERSDPDTAALVAWDKIPAGDYYKDQIAGQLWQTTFKPVDTESAEFKRWFGESKVVDAAGKPLTVYHSTSKDFTKFKPSRYGMFGRGVYLTTSDQAFIYGGDTPANMPVYARVEKPWVVDARDSWADIYEGLFDKRPRNAENEYPSDKQSREMLQEMQSLGYDGVQIRNVANIDEEGDYSTHYVAFDPTQIKSAISNTGEFSDTNPSILFAEAAGPRRGSFNPLTFDLRLLADANRSTFIHEASHFFMAAYIDMASQPDAPPALKQYVEDLLGYLFKNVPGGEQVGGEGLGQKVGAGETAYKAVDISSPEFKAWFGGSKVVDADGEPLRVFHGTKADIEAFSPEAIGSNFGLDKAGFFFTSEARTAKRFAGLDPLGLPPAEGGNVLPVYVSLKNPLTLDKYFWMYSTNAAYELDDKGISIIDLFDDNRRNITAIVAEEGYDGVLFEHNGESLVVALTPDQIKSTISNTGAFQGPNILEQDGQPATPGAIPEGRTNIERWNAMTLDQQRAYWEFFAEGFEQYAMSGKAPTKALQSAFSAFAKWMKEIYKTLKNFVTMHGTKPLDAELTQYFDRMLATDEELEAARAERGFQTLFKNLAESGMSPGQFADYMALDALQKTEAEELLRSRSIRDMKWLSNAKSKAIKEIQAEADELRNLVRAGVEEELANTPIRQAERWLRKGLMVQDGEQIKASAGHRFDIDIVKAMFPEGAIAGQIDFAKLGRGKNALASSTGTQHPDDVAKIFGFRNGEQLVRDLLDMPTFKDEVSHLTDLRMLEEHGDLATPEAIEKAADEAIHNDAHLKMVATEVWALTNRTGSVAALTKAAKAFASNLVSNTVAKKLSPVQFVNAATRAGKAAVRAMAKKDTDKAASEKRVEMVNAAAAKEAYAAEAEVRAIMTRLRKISAYSDKHSSITSREFGVVQAVRAILAEFDIGQHGEKATKYLKTLSEYDPTLGAVLDDTIEQLAPEAKPWPELKVADLRELHAAVTGLWRVAKEVRSVELAGEKMSLDDARAQLIAKLEETGAKNRQSKAFSLTDAEIRNQDFQSYAAKAIRPENWVSMKDGLDEYGPWRRLIWNTIDRAQLDYNADKGEKLKQLKALLVPIMADMTDIQIDAPELGGSFGAGSVIGYSELLHAILHTGNLSNKTKLLVGRGWGSLREDGSVDSTRWDSFMKRMWAEGKITKTHMDFVQGVWDLLESMKEGAQKAHRATTGRYFEEIEAAEIVTPFGVYRGGYAPAIADRRQVADMDIRKLQEAAEMDVVHSFDKPASGFTKSRVQNYNQKLELNIAAIGRHIDQVLLFAHMSGPVRNVQRVIKGKDLSNALAEADRAAMAHVLAPWLHSAATQVVTEKGKLSYENMALFTKLRSRAGMALMFANVSNSLQQLTSFFPAMLEVGKKDLLFAAAKGWYKPREMAASIAAMSPYMKQRLDNEVHAMAEEIDQILLNPTKFEKAQDWAVAHSYFLQMAVDTVMSPIIWQAKFNDATARGAEKQEAIDLADSAVRKSQGSNRAIDIAAMEKGSPFYRMFMQFAGYFNSQINLIGEKLARERMLPKSPAKYGRIAMILAQGWWAPAIASMAIALAMRGGPDDEDGDGLWDDWLTELLLGTVKYATASIPVFGQAFNATVNAFNDKPYDDRMSLSPAVSLIDASIRGGQAAVKSLEDPTKAGRAVRDLGSFLSLFGVPVTPITKAVGYATDVETGKVSPTSGADYARGIVTGVASPESKQ